MRRFTFSHDKQQVLFGVLTKWTHLVGTVLSCGSLVLIRSLVLAWQHESSITLSLINEYCFIIKDIPVRLQVRVMVRICSVHSSESSESMSLLKVDGRKKQLTLCETSAAGLSAAGHRRSSAAAPKTFLFDTIFSQDASQVRRGVLIRLTSPAQQHQTFILFFIMFEYSDNLLKCDVFVYRCDDCKHSHTL